MQNIRSKFYAAGFFMAILILVLGYATTTGNFGRLMHRNDVTMAFEDYKVDPAYEYYYFGTKNFPKAVVGISKYNAPGFWEPIELTSKQLHS